MRTLRYIFVAAFMACIPFSVSAQFMFGGGNRAAQDSLRKIAAADYADMLAKVGVGEPREGRQPNNPDESKHPNYDELIAKGESADFQQVLENLRERDRIDSTRAVAPLRQAEDALVLDNSHMSIPEQKQWLIDRFKERIHA